MRVSHICGSTALGLCLFVLGWFLPPEARADECMPGFTGYGIFDTYHYDSGVPSNVRNAFDNGTEEWNANSHGELDIQEETGGVEVVMGNLPPGTGAEFDPNENDGNGQLTVNDTWTDALMDELMAHEAGHLAGYDNVGATGCKGETIMYEDLSSSSLLGGDRCRLDQDYGGDGDGGIPFSIGQVALLVQTSRIEVAA